jgi:nucleotide-binding universal stress UspA family protein
MRVLIYVGPAPARELVLQFAGQIVQQVATSVTLITGGGRDRQALLDQAIARLTPPVAIPLDQRVGEGDAQAAILAAAREQPYDLVVLGRLNPPITRKLPGPPHSKTIARRLEPSVLRVDGFARPIRRILLASGGDYHTLDNARVVAQLAAPLGASVTLLHVISQQSLLFEGIPPRQISADELLARTSPEAIMMRDSLALMRRLGVNATVKARVGLVLDEILGEMRQGDYDLLTIGAHRITRPLDRILLEDLTGDLLDRCTAPMLVTKP